MDKAYRLTDGRCHGYRIGDIFDASDEILDLTHNVDRRMFAQIHKGAMALYTMDVLGLQGSGKTQYCQWMAYTAHLIYKNDLRILVVDNLDIAYREIAECPDYAVYLIIIEDAVIYHSSQAGPKAASRFNEWYMVRHKVEDAAKTETGRIIGIFNFQRYNTVHPVFRNPDIWASMSGMADEDDIIKLRNMYGREAYDALVRNYDAANFDYSLKSRAMIRIRDQPVNNSGVGWYHSDYLPDVTSWRPPKLLRTNEYYNAKVLTVEEILTIMSENPDMERDVEIYRRVANGEKQSDIAADLDISQSRISKIVKEVGDAIETERSQAANGRKTRE